VIVVGQGGARFELRFTSREEFAREYEANLKNLGIFLPAAEPLPLHTRIQLCLMVPGVARGIELIGSVVYVATAEQPLPGLPPGMAVQLQALPAECGELATGQPRVESPAPLGAPAPLESPAPLEAPAPLKPSEAEGEGEDKGGAGISLGDGVNISQAVRTAGLAEKIKYAKYGARQVLNVLIQEGDKQIMKFVIQNPRLGSAEVLLILKNPGTSLELIQAIAKNSGWMQNDEVRYQMVICPRTPLPLCFQLLNGLNPKDLSKIAKSSNVKAQLKSKALKLLMERH
jgi:hypothetical protein